MRTRLTHWACGTVFSLGVMAVGVGCQSANPAVQRSQQAANVLVDSRQSLVAGEQTVAESQAALKALGEAKGDLRPSFELFNAELAAVKRQAQQVAKDSDIVRSQAAVYCEARKSDINTIGNEDFRRVAELRTTQMKQQCDTINALYGQVNEAFARYIAQMADLQTFMASELNRGTLDSGQRWLKEAHASGEMLRGHIRQLALQVDMTSNVLSPVPIATTQWQTTLQHPDALASDKGTNE